MAVPEGRNRHSQPRSEDAIGAKMGGKSEGAHMQPPGAQWSHTTFRIETKWRVNQHIGDNLPAFTTTRRYWNGYISMEISRFYG